jgi:hypothetical protein
MIFIIAEYKIATAASPSVMYAAYKPAPTKRDISAVIPFPKLSN